MFYMVPSTFHVFSVFLLHIYVRHYENISSRFIHRFVELCSIWFLAWEKYGHPLLQEAVDPLLHILTYMSHYQYVTLPKKICKKMELILKNIF